MNCPNCGAIVLRGDRNCPKCDTLLGTTKQFYDPSTIRRSRLALLFRTWVGACYGWHLRWLGYDAEADMIRRQYGITLMTMIRIPVLLSSILYQVMECVGVMFGKYRTDSQGHPVRYLKGTGIKRKAGSS